LAIPDIRSNQLAPLDASLEAPYIRILPFPAGLTYLDEVPTEETEYAARVGADIGANLSVALSFMRVAHDQGALQLTNFVDISGSLGLPPGTVVVPTTAILSHPMNHVYGGSFNYFFQPLNIVIKGEVARFDDLPVMIAIPEPDPDNPARVNTFRKKKVTKTFLGIDKDLWLRWLAPSDMVNLSLEWYHTIIDDYTSDIEATEPEDRDVLGVLALWWWWHGKLNPMVAALYDTTGGGTWMTRAAVQYTHDANWYANMTAMAFWGDNDDRSPFAGLIPTSEISFKIGYQW